MTDVMDVTAPADGKTYTYSAVGLPSGLSIDGTSGAVTGTPLVNGYGTMTVTARASDNTQFSVSTNWAVSGIVPSADTEILELQELEALYISNVTMASNTDNYKTKALKVYAKIAKWLFTQTKTAVFDQFLSWMDSYKATYFDEKLFFQGAEGISSTEFSLISTIYTAFRSLTMHPNQRVDVSGFTKYKGYQAIVGYIESQVDSYVPSMFTPTTGKGKSNYVTPNVDTNISGSISMPLGARVYTGTVTGDTVLDFVKDPYLDFPNSGYFAHSRVVLALSNNPVVKLAADIKVSAQSSELLVQNGLSAYASGLETTVVSATLPVTHVILDLETYDSGETWVLMDVDTF